MGTTLPDLPQLEVAGMTDAVPVPLIRTEQDVARWHRSRGFETYILFLHRLNESVVGCMLENERLAGASPVREQRKYSSNLWL
jgi:serine/threonine-protein phosphatase 2A activator